MMRLVSGLLGALLLATGCGVHQGSEIYREKQCHSCHGNHLEGSPRGPSLLGLQEDWVSDEALAAYLRDPENSKRTGLEVSARSFKLRMMPVEGLPDQEMLILASWLRDPTAAPR